VNLSSWTITNLQPGVNDGSYVLVATSTGAGCSTVISDSISVTAAPALAFTQQPQSVTVSPPGTATFTAAATGIYDRVEWLQDGAPVQISVQPSPVESLTLTDVPAGVYSIQVRLLSAVCGNSVLSNVATLTVQAPGGCYANCDGSAGTPALSPADFTCFLSKYRAGDLYANCDGSAGTPALSPADFTCFLGKYRAGCP
jgi:hypothetical protein